MYVCVVDKCCACGNKTQIIVIVQLAAVCAIAGKLFVHISNCLIICIYVSVRSTRHSAHAALARPNVVGVHLNRQPIRAHCRHLDIAERWQNALESPGV